MAKVVESTTPSASSVLGMVASFAFFFLRSSSDIKEIERRKEEERREEKKRRNQDYVIAILKKQFQEAADLVDNDIAHDPQLVRGAVVLGGAPVVKRMIDYWWLGDREIVNPAVVWAADAGLVTILELLCRVSDYRDVEQKNYALRALVGAVARGDRKITQCLVKQFLQKKYTGELQFAQWHSASLPAHSTDRNLLGFPKTVIKAAIENQRVPALIYLLKKGASVSKGSDTQESDTALATTLKRSRPTVEAFMDAARIEEILLRFEREQSLLRSNGAVGDGELSLFELIERLPQNEQVRSEIYNRLLKCPALASVLFIDNRGDTLLHKSFQVADAALINRILTLNSELIEVENALKVTPLYHAIFNGAETLLEVLCLKGVH